MWILSQLPRAVQNQGERLTKTVFFAFYLIFWLTHAPTYTPGEVRQLRKPRFSTRGR